MAETTYELAGSVTLTIGSNTITLDSGDINASPLVYAMPPGTVVSTSLTDIVTWFNSTFSQSISVPSFITEKVAPAISIKDFYTSSEGDLSLDTKLSFNGGAGFEIFSGLAVNSFDLRFRRIPVSHIASFTPNTGTAGAIIKIGGTGLTEVRSVQIGTVTLATTDIIDATDNNFLKVKVPATGLTAGVQTVTIVDANGNSFTNTGTITFTYTES